MLNKRKNDKDRKMDIENDKDRRCQQRHDPHHHEIK